MIRLDARRWVVTAAAVAAMLGGASLAAAHDGAASSAPGVSSPRTPPQGPRGRLEVRSPQRDVLRLRPTEGATLGAEIEIANTGDGPLTVSRVSFLQGAEGSPRTPPGASASLSKGRDLKLAPGESRKVEVHWRSDLARTAELSGFVEIISDSAAPSATTFDAPALVGVVGDRRSGLGRVLASSLILLPMLVFLLALAAPRVRALRDHGLARAAAGVFGVHLLLTLIAAMWIDPKLTSVEGNEGVQYLELAQLPGGLGWRVGIDGASVPFLVAAAVVLLGAAVVGRRARLHAPSFHAGLALLGTSTVGALLALDLRLTVAFLTLAAPAAYLLISAGEGPAARKGAAGVAAIFAASAAIVLAGAFGLSNAAGPGLDLALGRTDATWMISELARVEWSTVNGRILGMHPATAAWLLPLVALALRAGLFVPALTGRALTAASTTASAALLGTALLPLGLLLVRLGLGPGAIAASSVAVWLAPAGLVAALIGVVDVIRARDLVRVAGGSLQVQAGLAVAALTARTPQGIEGAVATFAWHGLAAALLVLVAGALRDRVGTSDPTELGGLRHDMPRASLIAGLALMAAAGLPGLAGFWGPALNVAGLAARTPTLAIAGAGVLVAHAIALGLAHRRVFGGEVAGAWQNSKQLEPYGGHFPDLRTRELIGLAPIALMLLAMGLHPRALLAPTETKALELHRRVDPAGPAQVAAAEGPTPFETAKGRAT